MAEGAIAAGSWTNWAGNVRAAPRISVTPGSLGELRAVVIEAARRGETVRVAGAGHSFAPLCVTNGTLLDLSRLTGVERVDPETGQATVWREPASPISASPLAGRGSSTRQPRGYRPAGHRPARRSPPAPTAQDASTVAFPPCRARAGADAPLARELVRIDAAEPERLRAGRSAWDSDPCPAWG